MNKLKEQYLIRPKVSIITVVKNSQTHFLKTIKSVINQTYDNIEYVVIDGNSTDCTKEIIKKFRKNIDIYIREKDKNLWDAMNKGIKLSSGSIIAFINSDDIFNKNAVSIAVKYLRDRKTDFIFDGLMFMLDGAIISLAFFGTVSKEFK